MATTTNRYLTYPVTFSGIVCPSSGSAWTWSAYYPVVDANVITSDFYIAGITWSWYTPLGAVDTTYEWIIELATGNTGAEATIIQVPCSVRNDTAVGFVPSNFVAFPEPKYVPANTRISARVTYSAAAAQILRGLKILYEMV